MPEFRLLVTLLACCIIRVSALSSRAALPFAPLHGSPRNGTVEPYLGATPQPISIAPRLRGFGITTAGGSGRHLTPPHTTIFRVSSLRDSGPGTLRACLELPGPRTCLFEVAGEIQVLSPLRIRNPYISIAGQTAPSPGITISQGGLVIETHDVFIQHIAIRPGDSLRGVPAAQRDGISIGDSPPGSAYNVVLDHLSLTWAIDENLSTWHRSTRDVTVSNSIIAEGLHNSIHPKGPHSKGIMVGDGSKRITLYRNLMSSNEERNPYLKPGSETEMINNVVYGWGSRGGWSLCNLTNNEDNELPVKLSFIGNTYIPGPWSYITAPVYAKRLSAGSRVYTRDSALLASERIVRGTSRATALPHGFHESKTPPLRSPGRRARPRKKAASSVMRSVGSRPFDRSPIDTRIISDVQRRAGALKDCIFGCANAVGSLPLPATAHRPIALPSRPFDDDNRDGYTNLENWIFSLPRPNSS
jgi:hypothetical protein